MAHARMRSLSSLDSLCSFNTQLLPIQPLFLSQTPNHEHHPLILNSRLYLYDKPDQKNGRLHTLPPHKPFHRPLSNLPNRLFNPLSHLHNHRCLDLGLLAPFPAIHIRLSHRGFNHPRKQHSLILYRCAQWNYSRQQHLGIKKERHCTQIRHFDLVYAQQVCRRRKGLCREILFAG